MTVALMAGFYVGLKRVDLPEKRLDTTQYEEIDWARFTPAPPKRVHKAREAPAEPKAETRPVEPAARRVERIDLEDIASFFDSGREELQTQAKRPISPQRVAPMEPQIEESLEKPDLSTLLVTPSSSEVPAFRVSARAPGAGRSEMEEPALQVEKGSGLELPQIRYGAGSTSVAVRATGKSELLVPAVSMLDFTSLGEDYENLTSILDELIRWMRSHPADFSEVVRAFMGIRQDDLTSKARFRIGQRRFDLFLSFRDSEHELRICLVEGDRSIFLIDRGLKERSNYLRAGRVARDPGGRLVSFETSQRSPSDARTAEFYQLFLSWWERQKKDE